MQDHQQEDLDWTGFEGYDWTNDWLLDQRGPMTMTLVGATSGRCDIKLHRAAVQWGLRPSRSNPGYYSIKILNESVLQKLYSIFPEMEQATWLLEAARHPQGVDDTIKIDGYRDGKDHWVGWITWEDEHAGLDFHIRRKWDSVQDNPEWLEFEIRPKRGGYATAWTVTKPISGRRTYRNINVKAEAAWALKRYLDNLVDSQQTARVADPSWWEDLMTEDHRAKQSMTLVGQTEWTRPSKADMEAAFKEAKVGKKLPDSLYLHVTAVDTLPKLLYGQLNRAADIAGDDVDYDLVKIGKNGLTVSLLSYPNFMDDPHPALAHAVTINLLTEATRQQDYSQRQSPPILHRKEQFLEPGHPRASEFAKLTAQEKQRGLLGRPNIGTRGVWEDLLAKQNLTVEDHEVRSANTMKYRGSRYREVAYGVHFYYDDSRDAWVMIYTESSDGEQLVEAFPNGPYDANVVELLALATQVLSRKDLVLPDPVVFHTVTGPVHVSPPAASQQQTVREAGPASTTFQKPTQEMLDFFKQRTHEHIDRVIRYMEALEGFEGFSATTLSDRAHQHDRDKYTELVLPYIWITEYHRVKNETGEVPDALQEQYDLAEEALGKHVKKNLHHPEAHESPEAMSELDLLEMVADWSAMAEELDQGSARDWADQNIGTKWNFSSEQTEFIYAAIDWLEGKNMGQERTANYWTEQPLIMEIEGLEQDLDHYDDLWEAGKIGEETYHECVDDLYRDLQEAEQQLNVVQLRQRKANPGWWRSDETTGTDYGRDHWVEPDDQIPAGDILDEFDLLLDIQLRDGNWNYCPYMQGLTNGILLMRAIISGEIPEYIEAPDQWGKDKHNELERSAGFRDGFQLGRDIVGNRHG